MSEERRKRQQEREQQSGPSPWIRKIAILVLVAAVAIGLYALTRHRQSNRLNVFAQCLGDKGAKMYGAYWCPHCADQKEILGKSYRFVYVECGVPGSHAESEQCKALGVKVFPTWRFPDGKLTPGVFQVQELSDRTGCGLP